jgi:hypothetical protein
MANDPEHVLVGIVSQSVEDLRHRGRDTLGLVFGLLIYLAISLLGVGFLGLALLTIVPERRRRKEDEPAGKS